MDSKKRGLFILLAFVFIIIGGGGVYLTVIFSINTNRTTK